MSAFFETERVADVAEHASQLDSIHVEGMIRRARLARAATEAQKAAPKKQLSACLYCGSVPATDSAYCSVECRDDYEQEAAIRRRQGLR